MAVVDLLERPVYLYAEVDRLIGLSAGTARRWINGYERSGKSYEPILRASPADTEWASWGEFVEARMLAEYRDSKIPTVRLREAVAALRESFDLQHPLAHLRPYLTAQQGELLLDLKRMDAADEAGLMVLRNSQLLLGEPSRSVIESAVLARDERGEQFAAELTPDSSFPGIVLNPDRHGGEPTFAGRRVPVTVIAGMVEAGEDRADLAADYGLSLAQVQDAVNYVAKYGIAA